jgi:hypothetical protein
LLENLKRERGALRRQLSRLVGARTELEGPSRLLEELEAERQSLELANAGAVSDWVSGGCEGSRPALDPGRLSSRLTGAVKLP